MSKFNARLLAVLLVIVGLVATSLAASPASADNNSNNDRPFFTLTIMHNNDGESSLLPTEIDGAQYGGAARFARKVTRETIRSYFNVDSGESWYRGQVLLNSGDNFLAGTTFEASRQDGAPFYDAEFVRRLRYDALAVGNHEFDFGPGVFAEFVEGVQPKGRRTTEFVSANLDYSAEPSLAPFIGDELVPSTIVRASGQRIGVVGLTTESLPSISSPGNVAVSPDLVALAQAEIDKLTAKGVKIIVVQSHLQGLASEIALVSQLTDVDVVIGGGGDELLADADTQLVPGDEDEIFGEYPQIATDADGEDVPVVTTPGNYQYLGVLEVTFNKSGDVVKIDTDDSGIKVVTDTGAEAVGENRRIKRGHRRAGCGLHRRHRHHLHRVQRRRSGLRAGRGPWRREQLRQPDRRRPPGQRRGPGCAAGSRHPAGRLPERWRRPR